MDKKIKKQISAFQVPREAAGEVTLVWMQCKQSKQNLFQLISGALKTPINHEDQEKRITTHFILNRRLQRFIRNSCGEFLNVVSFEKRKKLLDNHPQFLVLTSLPEGYSRLRMDEDSDCGSDEETWGYQCETILKPTIDVRDGREVYVYKGDDTTQVKMEIAEPQSPPETSYFGIKCMAEVDEQPLLLYNSYLMGITLSEVVTRLRQLHMQERKADDVFTALIFLYGALDERGSYTKAHVFIHKGLLLFEHKKVEHLGNNNGKNTWCASIVHLCYHDAISLVSKTKLKPNIDCSSLAIGSEVTDVEDTNMSLSFKEIGNSDAAIMIEATVNYTEASHALPEEFELLKYPSHKLTEDDMQEIKGISEIDVDELENLARQQIVSPQCPQQDAICENDVVICRVIVMSRLQGSPKPPVSLVDFRPDPERIGKHDSIVVALGDRENIALPEKFSYEDPLTAIKIRSTYIQSSILARALKATPMSRSCSEAAQTRESSLLLQGQNNKFSVCKTLANFKRHNGDVKYLNAFAKFKYGDAVAWLRNQGRQGANGGDDATAGRSFEIRHFMESFLQLPQSVRYATSQMQFLTLSPPANLGVYGRDNLEVDRLGTLFLKTDDEAHMLHKRSGTPEREVSEEEVKQCFQYCFSV